MTEYKVGIEVKALFKKNHIDLLNPSPEAEALEEKRVMLINKVLKKVISGEPSLDDRKDIGYNRDSAHVLHNIIECTCPPQHHRVQGQHLCSTEDETWW